MDRDGLVNKRVRALAKDCQAGIREERALLMQEEHVGYDPRRRAEIDPLRSLRGEPPLEPPKPDKPN